MITLHVSVPCHHRQRRVDGVRALDEVDSAELGTHGTEDTTGMRYVELGRTGLNVSLLGLGCSRLGSVNSLRSEAETRYLIDTALDLGVSFFDTANIYGQGESERRLGRALRKRRDRVVLATKAGQRFPRYQRVALALKRPVGIAARWCPAVRHRLQDRRNRALPRDFAPEQLRRELQKSLRRLGTDYVDLFYLHSPSAADLEDGAVFEMMDRLREAGVVRSWGISCDSDEEVKAALRIAAVPVLQVPHFELLAQDTAEHCYRRARNRLGFVTRGIVRLSTEGLTAALRGAYFRAPATPFLIGTTNRDHLLQNLQLLEEFDRPRTGGAE